MRIYVFFVLLVFSFFVSGSEPNLQVKVYNVGQGNFVRIRSRDEDGSIKYMIVDIGSSSFKQEWFYRAAQQISSTEPFFESPVKVSYSGVTPLSDIKVDPYRSVVTDVPYGITIPVQGVAGFLKGVRDEMKHDADVGTKGISIHTVLITHPDSDHYNWLMNFIKSDDKVDYIIFGGLPEKYYEKQEKKFKVWITQRILAGTKIYFPAVKLSPLEQSLDEVLPHEGRQYAPPCFGCTSQFGEAFLLGSHVSVIPLLVNPSHIEERNGAVVRFSNPDEGNADSIVLKIAFDDDTFLLPGDAPEKTMARILNYYDEKDIESTVYLASHHGSALEGANSKRWIKIIKPHYIIVSHGHSQGHPHKEAYDAFSTSSALQQVSKHDVFVGKRATQKESFDNKATLHNTTKALYSTLASGTITVSFSVDRQPRVEPERKETTPLKGKEVAVTFQEEGGAVIITPSKVQDPGIRLSHYSIPKIKPYESTIGFFEEQSPEKKRKRSYGVHASDEPETKRTRHF